MQYVELWNSKIGGCKPIDEICKIKWFDSSLVLEYVHGSVQMDKYVTEDKEIISTMRVCSVG